MNFNRGMVRAHLIVERMLPNELSFRAEGRQTPKTNGRSYDIMRA